MGLYITPNEFNSLSEEIKVKWTKPVSVNLNNPKFDRIVSSLTIIHWCNSECDGRWSGSISSMIFENQEDQVKFILEWV